MVVQQQIELIACLSRDSEMLTGSSKAQLYWPINKETPLNIQSLRINMISAKETSNSIKRICTVTNLADSSQKVRTVVLFQYKYGPSTTSTNLPQSGRIYQFQDSTIIISKIVHLKGFGLNEMPENVAGFLKFVKECEHFYVHEQRNADNPVLVHCMNGVSRSAVFLVVYSLIQIIDEHCEDPHTQVSTISETLLRLVKQMRNRRKYMIQSTYHLKYSYNAILYYVKDILIKQGT
jgi:protein tyrosine phosphatase